MVSQVCIVIVAFSFILDQSHLTRTSFTLLGHLRHDGEVWGVKGPYYRAATSFKRIVEQHKARFGFSFSNFQGIVRVCYVQKYLPDIGFITIRVSNACFPP